MRVLIIGAGVGGLATAIELRRQGFRDVVVLERAGDLGGTWLHNRYPGAACDVPSHFYSFSYAQRRDWTRLCSPQPEILAYLHDVARAEGVDSLLVTGANVERCAWEGEQRGWRVCAADGREWRGDALVIATGQLHQPAIPALPGAESFAGPAFHSAEWDEQAVLAGRRVAVIGTGATSVQLLPELAETAASVTVFQRTGNWFLPRRNRPYPPAWRAVVARVPGLQALRRRYIYNYTESLTLMIRNPRTFGRVGRLWSAGFMRWQLRGDPELRRQVWPDYTFGCKRVLFSSLYLPALRRRNVELVNAPVTGITEHGVLTGDGVEHPADCIVYATGFRTNEFMFPMEVQGRDGVQLADAWRDGAHAHLGICVPRFPSLFLVYGPNTNTSGGSIIQYEESQARYIRQALVHTRARRAAAMEVRADVEAASDRELQARFAGTAWTACQSWYREDGSGRIVANWPGYMREYEAATQVLDPREYVFLASAAPADPASVAAP